MELNIEYIGLDGIILNSGDLITIHDWRYITNIEGVRASHTSFISAINNILNEHGLETIGLYIDEESYGCVGVTVITLNGALDEFELEVHTLAEMQYSVFKCKGVDIAVIKGEADLEELIEDFVIYAAKGNEKYMKIVNDIS